MTLSEQIRPIDLSLMHGWIPTTVQVVAVVALIAAVGWRTRRWRFVWVPWAVLVGVTLAVTAYWYVASEGLADNPAPTSLWIWIALSGVAAGVMVAGWRGARWWRRGVSLLAVPLTVLCAALSLNLLGRLLPDRVDRMESVDRRAAARSDGSGRGDCDAEAAPDPRQGHAGAGGHRRHGVGLQAP